NVSVGGIGGFSGSVCLSVSQLPPGASAQFSAPCTNANGSPVVMTIFTTGATPVGTFTPIIAGVNGLVSHSSPATFTVNDFTLSVSPSSSVVLMGDSTAYQVTVNPINGFSGLVTFGAQGFPGNVSSATFSPNPATSSTTLTIATNGNTDLGTFPLSIS